MIETFIGAFSIDLVVTVAFMVIVGAVVGRELMAYRAGKRTKEEVLSLREEVQELAELARQAEDLVDEDDGDGDSEGETSDE